MELPDPRSPPSRSDKLAKGEDCYRHPLVGNICTQAGGTPGEQARNYLLSLRKATLHQTAGRTGPDLSAAEYAEWMRKLEVWENAGNEVALPPAALPASYPHAKSK